MNVIEEKIIKDIVNHALPKPEDDQNTDDIVPARYLKKITFSDMGDFVYFDERVKDGEEHPFNDSRYSGATILIGGANYGSGSSREHAPQALHRYGIQAIIAESFAEIFAGNCASIGVVGVTIPRSDLTALAKYVQKKPSTEISLDLEAKTVSYEGNIIKCDIPEGRRQAFLTGTWDAMAVLQQNMDEIEALERNLEYLQFE